MRFPKPWEKKQEIYSRWAEVTYDLFISTGKTAEEWESITFIDYEDLAPDMNKLRRR